MSEFKHFLSILHFETESYRLCYIKLPYRKRAHFANDEQVNFT